MSNFSSIAFSAMTASKMSRDSSNELRKKKADRKRKIKTSKVEKKNK